MARHVRLAVWFALAMLPAGCSAPTATLDLIGVARKAVALQRDAQRAQHEQIVRHFESQKRALDAAFDADVRLAAAGQITDPAGTPVAMTAEWIISARKGYAAARDIIDGQIASARQANATHTDNLAAADEALDLAGRLIVQQWSVGERIKQNVLDFQRRSTDGK